MKIPLAWLNMYCDVSDVLQADMQQFSDDYTVYSAEVEEMIPHLGIDKVVIGKILSYEKHPDADKLTVVQVDTGSHGTHQIVCGAPNVVTATYVAVALEGCQMAPDFVIGKRDLKGIESCGMICSADELGLQPDRSPGILDLHTTFTDVDLEEKIGKDFFSLGLPFIAANKTIASYPLRDVTMDLDNKFITNRPDLFGVYGNARECSAIYRKNLENYCLEPISEVDNTLDCDIQSEDTYTYALDAYEGVTVTESPLVIKTLLHRAGHGVKNNLVDITNLICTEMAQPMHCFDADKIRGKIHVRNAKKGENFLGLDDVEYELTNKDIVIADDSGCIALAGVIGGKESAVQNETTNIIVEAATFDAISVRKTASRLGIRTDSSLRFEKSLDPTSPKIALARFQQLLKSCKAGGKKTASFAHEKDVEQVSITVDWDNLKTRISKEFSDETVLESLGRLGFSYDGFVGNSIQIKVPSWRATKDVQIQEDIIEEVARMLNYNTYEPVHLDDKITTTHIDPTIQKEQKLRHFFISQGFYDVYSYTFTHPDRNRYFQKEKNEIELSHPYSEDHSVMRSSLFDSLLSLAASQIREHDIFSFFESGSVFGEDKENRQSRASVGICIGHSDMDINTILTNAFTSLGHISNIEREHGCPSEAEHIFHPNKSAMYIHDDDVLATYGRIHPTLAKQYDLPTSTILFELHKTDFVIDSQASYAAIPKYPAIVRELNFVMDEKTPISTVCSSIQDTNDLIQSIYIDDVYRDTEKLGADKKSVVFSVKLMDTGATLTDEQAGKIQSEIIAILEKKGISIRG